MRKWILLPALALFALPAAARAEFEQGNFALTLSGSGSNDKDFETGQFAVDGELGYFVTKEVEVAVRQGIIWGDGGSSFDGRTAVAADYNFNLGDKWVPFAGAAIGYRYGETTEDTWIAGPEAGLRYFVNTTTYVQGIVSYDFSLNNGFDSGAFNYGLGIGFRF